MTRAAIVLSGGRSRRMGRDKASLPFGDETLLGRIVRVVSACVDEVWVVAREGQDLPRLPESCRIAHDPREGLGPLAGLTVGLEAMASESAFVTTCDVPLLQPAYVERLFELSTDELLTLPFVDGHHMVTSAVYSRSVAPRARALLDANRLRPFYLMESVQARIVTEDELRAVDPELHSLRDCNTPDAYEEALRIAGLE